MKTIKDVQLISLKKVVNERGHLVEIQRADDAHYLGFGQTYVTATLPGIVKAWYRHHHQVDQLALIKGELLLALYDARDDSLTRGNLVEITITEQAPLLVQIPPGVWHGFKALGNEPAFLLHLNTVAYNFQHVDEDRLPSDTLSIPYEW